MKQLRNILVVVDPTREEQPAITKAARLASHFDARVQLFACETPSSRETRLMNERVRSGAAGVPGDLPQWMEILSAPLRRDGLEVTLECKSAKHLHPAIRERACATQIDLLVKDTHHHSLVQRAFLTNVDWQLIRECGVPLLLTKATPWKEHPVILAALDPYHEHDKPFLLDHDLLEWGVTLRAALRGTLHGTHTYVPSLLAAAAVGTAGAAAITPELILDEESKHRARLRELTLNYDIPAHDLHVDMGSAADVIPQIAKGIDADIVAMGAVSRSAAELVLVGHTAERVLERLEADVLVVKPPNFSACLPW
ncbi:MAG: universal stress protein [Steroidobacteraceae bacterium]